MKIRNHYKIPEIQSGYELDPGNGWFSVLVPIALTTINTNPSLELGTTGYTAVNSVLARVSTYQRRGVYSMSVTPSSTALSGTYLALTTVTGSQYSCGLDLYAPGGGWFDLYFADSSGNRISRVASVRGANYWKRLWVNFSEYAGGSRRVYLVRRAGGNTQPFYVDGVNLLPTQYKVAYFDGDKKGFLAGTTPFYWNGTPHASTSTQILDCGNGGYEVNLLDLGFRVMAVVGLGMMQFANISTPISDGGARYQRSVPVERSFALVGTIMGSTLDEIQRARASLQAALTPQRTATMQELVLRYHRTDPCTGDETETLDIPCVFDSAGLAGSLTNNYQENIELPFKQFFPAIYTDGQLGSELKIGTSLSNINYIIEKLSDGTWSAMNGGLNGGVTALAYGPDGTLYAGGGFSLPGGNYAAKWDGSSWTSLGTGLNGTSEAIAIGPDGKVYYCGAFTSAGGVAVNNIAVWDGSAWAALGTGLTGGIGVGYKMAFGPDGKLYVVGAFTSAGGVAANYIAAWDGSVWSALGSGFDAGATALVFGQDGTLYAGGAFTTAGGNPANYVAKWDGSAWSALGSGMDTFVQCLEIGAAGTLFAGGNFTTADGLGALHIASWNGAAWSPVGVGLDDNVYHLEFSTDGVLYIGGVFTASGSLSLKNGLARYYNYVYDVLDIDVVAPDQEVRSMAISVDGGLAIGGNYWSATTALSSAITTVSKSGSGVSDVVFQVSGPGTLYRLANLTTNEELVFDNLFVMNGEKLTITTYPEVSVISDKRGDLTSYILSGFSSQIKLQKGSNSIQILMSPSVIETGDNNNQLSTYNLAGIQGSNTDVGKLYVSITYSAPNYRIRIYKDAARSQEVANSANYTTTGIKAISEANSSGISGYITVDATVAADADIVITFPLATMRWTPQYSGIDEAVR